MADDPAAIATRAYSGRPLVPAPPTPAVPVPVPRLVGLAWAFLLVNTLGFSASALIIPFPRSVGQIITMGLLLAAFALALVLNPRIRLHPNLYLVLLTLMALVATVSSLRLESGTGSLLRCFRLLVFVATLWLLSAWWHDAMRLARIHLRAVAAVLSTVLAGLIISPGAAFSGPEGRLVGALWPIPAPQVGMYCSISVGLSVLLWLYRRLDGPSTLVIGVPAIVLLLLSHTRTALLGLVVALTLAGLSAVFTESRIRRFLGMTIAFGVTVAALFGAGVQTWLARGQDASDLANLTGRTKVWDALLSRPRTFDEQLVGLGLSDKSYNGLPIDNAWLSIFNELGWAGIVIVAAILLGLLVAAALRPPSPQRTCAIFLVTYSCVASYTEVGLGDASPYLLNLCVAAALIASPAAAAAQRPRWARAS